MGDEKLEGADWVFEGMRRLCVFSPNKLRTLKHFSVAQGVAQICLWKMLSGTLKRKKEKERFPSKGW